MSDSATLDSGLSNAIASIPQHQNEMASSPSNDQMTTPDPSQFIPGQRRKLLNDIPLEVRNKIWRIVVQTETGSVHLEDYRFAIVPTEATDGYSQPERRFRTRISLSEFCSMRGYFDSGRDPPSFDYLRVSKQMYAEMKGLFWKYNAYILHGPCMWGCTMWGCKSTLESHREIVRQLTTIDIHLEIDCATPNYRPVEDLKTVFQHLVTWSTIDPDFNKKVFVFCPITSRQCMERFLRFRDDKITIGANKNRAAIYLSDWIAVVKKFLGTGGPLSHLQRKTKLNTGWRQEKYGQRGWMRKAAGSMKELNATVRDLHDIFGGEMWVDGFCCYRDGRQCAHPFPLKPLPASVREREGITPEDLLPFVPPR